MNNGDPLLKIGDEIKEDNGVWHKIIGFSSRFCGHLGEVKCYKLHDGYTWPIKSCDNYIKNRTNVTKII